MPNLALRSDSILVSTLLVLCAGLPLLWWLSRRALSAFATLRARAWTPTVARAMSNWMHLVEGHRDALYGADGAPPQFVAVRKAALGRLQARFASRGTKSAAWAESLRGRLSDLRFADASRVPFPFARAMREGFNLACVADTSRGSRLRDLDDNWSIDVSGSYGVNLAGYDRYKSWLERGWEHVRQLGPVLGPLHPLVSGNAERLAKISGLDEVSFHASGTEAVMAACRLARFNTRRKLIVCFSGAYHGWWDGVQPGLGSERAIEDCLTLKDMDDAALRVIKLRASQIAGVLVNPVQAFHPNSPPPNDAVLLNSDIRKTAIDTSPYGEWLRKLAATCRAAGVPLIFDEVFSGFRVALGGAQALYGVQADLVVYGKTVAGGMPIGVVCGRHALMRRFDPERPLRMAYVVGTFAAHPLTMGAMHEFLNWATSAEALADFAELNARTTRWVTNTNEALAVAGIPLVVTNLASIWTLQFMRASRYNWLLQYYLRVEGVNLSWVGTGRCMFNLEFSDDDFRELTAKLINAGRQMMADKWWLSDSEHPQQANAVKAGVRRDLTASLLAPPRAIRGFYGEVMRRKHDDHVASHSNRVNQFLHLLSSSTFIVCYGLIFVDLVAAMWLGLAALFVRQLGHAVLEPPCHDKEQLLLGFDTRSKTKVVAVYLSIPILNWWVVPLAVPSTTMAIVTRVAEQWLFFTIIVVLGHVVRLMRKHGVKNALVWFVKLVTDPLTDIAAYYPVLKLPSR